MVKKMEVVKQCPICGGSGSYHGERNDAGVIVKMDKCAECGTLYQNPRLTEQGVSEFYQNGSYNRAYLSRASMQDRANRLITMLRLMEITPKRVLDVGCARGDFLRNTQIWFGSQVVGLDHFVDNPLISEIVTSKDEVDGEFDLIACIHTFEHFYDPQAELDWMVSKLAPGGTLLIEVPTVEKITFPHLYIFSEKAIRLMVERTGMECMYINQEKMAQVFIGNGYGRFSIEHVTIEAPEIQYRGLYGFR